MRPKRWMLILSGLTGLGVMLGGCGGHGTEAQPAPSLLDAEVKITEVQAAPYLRKQGLPGTVHPADQALIAAKVMATVETVDLEIGQRVREGETLIVLRADEIGAQVEQAEAGLAQLQRNLARERALLEQSATTAEAVRTLEDEIRLAEARLAEARTMESYLRIRSPFDGIITSKAVMRGDLASPGNPLLTVEGLDALEIHVQVPDSLMPLEHGALVEVENGEKRFEARLAEWSPAADPASRTRLVKLATPADAGLRSGQYVRVNWPAEEVSAIWIPETAISRMGQLERAFTFDGQTVQMQIIKTGREVGGKKEVISGLRPGDKVVTQPVKGMVDGQPAKIVQ